jgi:hypothetical protein
MVGMDEKRKERTIDVALMAVMGLMVALPILLYVAASGVLGKVTLLGKSEFSPWMDRLLLLGTSFWLMYGWSWFVPEIKNRAPKVFGCTALFAILSIAVIQLDNLLIPGFADIATRDAANIWFFNLPYYALRIFSNNVPYNAMSLVVMGLMLVSSGALLWWIKSELAGTWKKAFAIWGMYEITFFIAAWIMFRIFGPIMFLPQTVM